jgi:hypothetical protein
MVSLSSCEVLGYYIKEKDIKKKKAPSIKTRLFPKKAILLQERIDMTLPS